MIADKMEYIFAIAEEQNLTRAAKRLFIAQSTLTMYLNRVEGDLGIKLFDRTKSPILPTPAGRLYIEELKKIEKIEKNLHAKLDQIIHPEETLNIGIGPMRSINFMSKLLPAFRELYPDVIIHLVEQGDETLPAKLHAGDVDVVIGTMSMGADDVTVDLALEQVLLIAPRSFDLVPYWMLSKNSCDEPYEISPAQLDHLPLILPDPMNDLHSFSTQILDHYMIHPKSVITTSSMSTAAILVSKDLGYLFTSPVFLELQKDLLQSKIVYCTMKDLPSTRKLIAAYSASNIKEKMILQLLQLLRTTVLPYQTGAFLIK